MYGEKFAGSVNPECQYSSIVIAGRSSADRVTRTVGTILTTTVMRPSVDRQAVSISRDGFDALIVEHQRHVYRVVLLLTRDADAADTLTQECFLRAYQHLDSFRGECAVRTWLLRIAANLVRDHNKNKRASFWKRLIGLESAGSSSSSATWTTPEPSAERILLGRENLAAVWRTVDFLSPQQKAIFLLRFAEEMELAEIADVLGLKVGSVKAQLFRALASVRKQMKGEQ
jgi:RNA polymerase sigma-70 factor (ECF subfamily)